MAFVFLNIFVEVWRIKIGEDTQLIWFFDLFVIAFDLYFITKCIVIDLDDDGSAKLLLFFV